MASPDPPGRRFSPLRVLAPSTLGRVQRARDLELGREVVVRTLGPRLDPEVTARVLAAARAARAVRHLNLLRILDVVEGGAAPCLVLEPVEGTSLAARLARGRLAPAAARRVVVQVGKALEALHRAGVVHGDVRAENVLLRGGEEADAVLCEPAPLGAGAPGAARRAALAPEVRGGGAPDPRADVFQLGRLLAEACAGEGLQALAARAAADAPEARPAELAGWLRQLEEAPLDADAGSPAPAGRPARGAPGLVAAVVCAAHLLLAGALWAYRSATRCPVRWREGGHALEVDRPVTVRWTTGFETLALGPGVVEVPPSAQPDAALEVRDADGRRWQLAPPES